MSLDRFSVIVTMLGGLIVVLSWIAVRINKPLRMFQQIRRDWFGEPARPDIGDPGKPGVLQRIHNVDQGNLEIIRRQDEAAQKQAMVTSRVAALEKQMYPNGGSSIADKINQIAAAVVQPTSPAPSQNGDHEDVHA